MAYKNIPEIGEFIPSTMVPAGRRVLHVTAGAATTNPDVVLGDIAVNTLVHVTEPIIVFNMWTQVEEAFTSSVINLGDTGNTSLFDSDTTILSGSTGAVLIGATGLAVPYVYAAGQDLVVEVATATVSTGLVDVYIDYAVLED